MGFFDIEVIAKAKPLQIIENPQLIGEHLKKRRLQLRLLQADVANMFAVCEDSITGWENGRSEPQIQYYPKIIQFLGYNPFPVNTETLGGRIHKYRIEHGLSHKKFGKLIGIDASTIRSWEDNHTTPGHINLRKIKEFIN